MTQATFRKGETALIVHATAYPQLVGMECELLSDLEELYLDGEGFCHVYRIEIPAAPTRGLPARADAYDGWIIHPLQLAKLPRAGTGSCWSEGCWVPDLLRAQP